MQNQASWSPFKAFLDEFCDIKIIQKLEMDTDSPYLALAEKELTEDIRPEIESGRERLQSRDCDESFAADASGNFFLRTCCAKHKQNDKKKSFSKKISRVRKCCAFVVNIIADTPLPRTIWNSAAKVSIGGY